MGFPDRLKELRKQRKLTQEELGKKVNVTKVSISGYENGNRMPDTETLQRLADFFGESVDYLLGRTDDSNQDKKGNADNDNLEKEIDRLINDPETGIFFKGYLEAPEEKKKQMRDFMRFLLQEEKGRKPGDKQ